MCTLHDHYMYLTWTQCMFTHINVHVPVLVLKIMSASATVSFPNFPLTPSSPNTTDSEGADGRTKLLVRPSFRLLAPDFLDVVSCLRSTSIRLFTCSLSLSQQLGRGEERGKEWRERGKLGKEEGEGRNVEEGGREGRKVRQFLYKEHVEYAYSCKCTLPTCTCMACMMQQLHVHKMYM